MRLSTGDARERRGLVDVLADCSWRGAGRRTSALDGCLYLRFGALTSRIELALRHALRKQVLLQPLDRILLAHRRERFLRTILLGDANVVARHSVRHAFEQI